MDSDSKELATDEEPLPLLLAEDLEVEALRKLREFLNLKVHPLLRYLRRFEFQLSLGKELWKELEKIDISSFSP